MGGLLRGWDAVVNGLYISCSTETVDRMVPQELVLHSEMEAWQLSIPSSASRGRGRMVMFKAKGEWQSCPTSS